MKNWKAGDRARIAVTAFPGSLEPCDALARGKVGVLIEQMDDDLWLWRSDDGTVETAPTTEELEEVEEED